MKPILLLLLLPAILLAQAVRQVAVTTDEGLFVRTDTGDRGPVRRTAFDDPQILWSRNHPVGIFNSTATTTSRFAYSGSWLNDPREAAQYEIQGDGTPVFTLLGTEWEVAAAPQGGLWAAADRDNGGNGLLYLLADTLAQPLWTYDLGNGFPSGGRGLGFSGDGHVLAAWLGRPQGFAARLLAWDMTDPDSIPEVDYEVPAGQGDFARALALSADSHLISCTAGRFCHVVEFPSGAVRDTIDFASSTDGLAISADGQYVFGGFAPARMYAWDGTEYQRLWSVRMNQLYASQLLISPDNSYAVSVWYPITYDQNYVRVHDLLTGAPFWWYTYRRGTGLQDWPIDVDISDDGKWFAVGSWGDEGHTNGEAVVFSRWYPWPYYELNMPGSCFSLDMSADGRLLIAGGKHIHANISGRGGDLFVVDLDLPTRPSASVANPLITEPDTVCLCQDTVQLSVVLANTGFAPFHVTDVQWRVPTHLDQTYFAVDSSVFSRSVMPAESITAHLTLAPCDLPPFVPPFFFDFSLSDTLDWDTLLVAEYQTACVPCDQSISDHPPVVEQFALNRVFPNPFNSATTVDFTLPAPSPIKLRLLNLLGQEVSHVDAGLHPAGRNTISLNAVDLASGVYLLSLQSASATLSRKIVLLR